MRSDQLLEWLRRSFEMGRIASQEQDLVGKETR